MGKIVAPVGPWNDPKVSAAKGNRPQDVKEVQELLIAASSQLKRPQLHPGKPDGKIHRIADRSNTLQALYHFQKGFLAKPDRRVDVAGKTIRKLNQYSGKPAATKLGTAAVVMTNKNSTRNLPITETLKRKLSVAVGTVFGAHATAYVYSGGQPAKGTSTKRVGSVRHDLGHAADLTITLNGSKVQLAGMEELGQWWLASKYGCAGVGMQGGRGIHLDEWNSATGPKLKSGMGPYWTYAAGAGPNTKSKLRKGHAGQKP